jgi:hypothetical protein
MRTVMKKSGVVAALTAVLLVMAVLVTTGCWEPETGAYTKPIVVGQVGPDMGTIRLVFGDDTGARTVIPNAPTFTKYVLTFAGAQALSQDVTPTGANTPFTDIELAAGNYTLTVTGLITGDLVVASASTADGGVTSDNPLTPATNGFIVDSNSDTMLTVVLKPTQDEDGSFSWNVTTSGFTGTVVVSVGASLAGGGAVGGTPTPVPVASGYYPILVNIDAGALGTLVFGDYVHIYDYRTSTFTKTFTLANLVPPPPVPDPGSAKGGITFIQAEDDASVGLSVVATAPTNAADILTFSLTGYDDGTTIHPTAATVVPSAGAAYYGDTLLSVINVNTYPFNGVGDREVTIRYVKDGITHTAHVVITVIP